MSDKTPSEPPRPPASPKPARPAKGGDPTALAQPMRAGVVSGAGSYGAEPDLPLTDILDGVEAENIESCGLLYLVGKYAQIGVYRAMSVFVARFLSGDLDLPVGTVRSDVCAFIDGTSQRLGEDVRDSAIVDPAREAALERHMDELCNALLTVDQSERTGCAPLTPLPPEVSILLAGEKLQELQVACNRIGAGGLGFIAREAFEELVQIDTILDNDELCGYVPGLDIFERGRALLAGGKDWPTPEQARFIAREGFRGREYIRAVAAALPAGDEAGVTDLGTIATPAYEWQVAHGSLGARAIEPLAGSGLDEEAARQIANVIRFRARG